MCYPTNAPARSLVVTLSQAVLSFLRRIRTLDVSHDVAFSGISSSGIQGGPNAASASAAAAPGVLWLDLDQVEQRWLLAGTADATVAVYDTQVGCGPLGHDELSDTMPLQFATPRQMMSVTT